MKDPTGQLPPLKQEHPVSGGQGSKTATTSDLNSLRGRSVTRKSRPKSARPSRSSKSPRKSRSSSPRKRRSKSPKKKRGRKRASKKSKKINDAGLMSYDELDTLGVHRGSRSVSRTSVGSRFSHMGDRKSSTLKCSRLNLTAELETLTCVKIGSSQ